MHKPMITPQKAETRFHEIEAKQQADPNRSRYLEELTRLRAEVNLSINRLILKKSPKL